MALIYIAGPYTAETEDATSENVCRACAAGKAVLDRGHWPIIPHLSLGYDLWHESEHGEKAPYETYMQWGLELLRRCDGLLYLAASPGADRELALAEEMGMPVYRAIAEVPMVRAG